MSEQKGRIDSTEWDCLIIMDAGRPDVFETIVGEKELDDSAYTTVNNGGHGFTANWMAHHFPDDYDAGFFHGGQPIHSMQGGAEWDERDHFAPVPEYTAYEWEEDVGTCAPHTVNKVVKDAMRPADRMVVRYLCPHPPFPKLVEYTRGRGNRTRRIAQAVRSGEITTDDVWMAYQEWYHNGIDYALALAEWVDGTTVITADHGECLGDCGQWFHGPIRDGGHEPHEHLVDVPWLVIE